MPSSASRRHFLAVGAALLAAPLLPGFAFAAPTNAQKAAKLYRKAIVIDGNLVPPLDSEGPLPPADAALVKGSGLTAIKATLGGSKSTYAQAEEMITGYDAGIVKSADLYRRIDTIADIHAAKREGKVGVIFSFESADMFEGKVDNIDHFAKRNVRVMQLSYNTASPFGSGVMSPQPSAGLTDLGRQAVERMNKLGVTLDLSHSDEPTTLDAIKATRKTPLVTHAGCSAVYAHPRNKSDKVLRALAERGGVVGLYELSFISAGPAQQSIDEYLAHVLHALKICGEDHVGIGSDAIMTPFDTSPESMAAWNKDIEERKRTGVGAPGEGRPPFVEGLNRADRSLVIAEKLLDRGVSERAVEKILGENFLRVFKETWAV